MEGIKKTRLMGITAALLALGGMACAPLSARADGDRRPDRAYAPGAWDTQGHWTPAGADRDGRNRPDDYRAIDNSPSLDDRHNDRDRDGRRHDDRWRFLRDRDRRDHNDRDDH